MAVTIDIAQLIKQSLQESEGIQEEQPLKKTSEEIVNFNPAVVKAFGMGYSSIKK